MIHADFQFKYIEDAKLILIKDLNLGNRSVTNDIEWVLEQIEGAINKPNLKKIGVYYLDSDKLWTGYDPVHGNFYNPSEEAADIEVIWEAN